VFTGLIADLGEVAAVAPSGAGVNLEVATALANEIAPGDSVAVNGVCLTATVVHARSFETQAVSETLSRSTLGSLAAGARVNVELSLRAGDRLGGHVVQGHVDGVGTVAARLDQAPGCVLTIAPGATLSRYIVEKGSIAVNGVSLTVSALGDSDFSVALIPETLQRTSLGQAGVGDRVNLEVDIMAKQIERLLEARQTEGAPRGTS
jgi:riboflavin synthase